MVIFNASFTAAGNAIIIEEDDPSQKLQSKCKTHAIIALGFKPHVGKHFSIHRFHRHSISNTLFPSQTYPSSSLERMRLRTTIYIFVNAHVAWSMNTAADFLSRTEVNPIEQLEMTIRNDIQTKAIEVNTIIWNCSGRTELHSPWWWILWKPTMARKTKREKSSSKRNTQWQRTPCYRT